jgi:hypothetical protein
LEAWGRSPFQNNEGGRLRRLAEAGRFPYKKINFPLAEQAEQKKMKKCF